MSPYLTAPVRSLHDVIAARRVIGPNGRPRQFRVSGSLYTAVRFYDHAEGDRMVAGKSADGAELQFRAGIVEWVS